MGRAANVNDGECPPELSIVTRWQIGGSGVADADVPPQPSFGLGPGQRGGTLELSGLSFADLTNTRSVAAATLTLRYWDELQGLPLTRLAGAMAVDATELTLSSPGGAQSGSLIQIAGEVLAVGQVDKAGTSYQVTRGAYDTQATEYAAGTPVYHLLDRVAIAPFPAEFFGSAYSGNWTYPISLPNARVAAADLFVTNSRGNSPSAGINLTGTTDNGLRTLSGGQIDLTIDGVVAVESDAVPAATLARASSVRNISATVQQASDGQVSDGHGGTVPSALSCVVKVGGSAIATLTIPAGESVSNTIDMTTNPSVEGLVIPADQPITLDVITVGSSYPGKRLTVTVRL
jgi:hypothetical protein